jgi:transcriptional regulator of acetoin/glycerol metabolism
MALFERYAWPGNIRQLANVLRTGRGDGGRRGADHRAAPVG